MKKRTWEVGELEGRPPLEVLRHAKQRSPERPTKSSLMVGVGETDDEVLEALTGGGRNLDHLDLTAPFNGLKALRREFGLYFFGIRSGLAERSVVADLQLTQFYQGVASGGEEQTFRYGAKLDLFADFDTEKMGLWKGGNLYGFLRLGG